MYFPKQKPLVLIAGFLGAGKTTSVRGLLTELSDAGVRADVILNDIENATLDAASINPEDAESIVPLAASCACCESLEELAAMCGTAAKSEGDLLLIELNGTADPVALLESFTLLEEQLPFSDKYLVCVVDARNWGARSELTPLERRQMDAAGLHILSHVDQADSGDIERVKAAIRKEFPNSQQVSVEQLGQALTNKSPIPAVVEERLRSSCKGHDEHHEHRHDEVHLLSHQIKGCQIPLPGKVRTTSVERLLDRLPKSVLRAKALVKLIEEPGTRWLFERSGDEVAPSPTPVPGITRTSPSLLCIGFQLDPDPIRELVSEEFGYIPEPVG